MVKLEYWLQIKTVLTTGDVIRMTLPLVIKSPEEYAMSPNPSSSLHTDGGSSHFGPPSFRAVPRA
jgi:hypothetical protein